MNNLGVRGTRRKTTLKLDIGTFRAITNAATICSAHNNVVVLVEVHERVAALNALLNVEMMVLSTAS